MLEIASDRLVSLRISNGALKGEKLPERIKVLGWGRNDSAFGPILFDDASVAALGANQRKLGHDRVALDFEHNTVPGSEEFARTREPREVAAFGAVEALSGDGLYLRDLTWTPSGRANARNYEDLSLAPRLDAENRVIFVHSAALTRNGAVYDLSFFSAAGNVVSLHGLARAAHAITADLLRRGLITAREAGDKHVATFKAELKFGHLRGRERTAAAINADLLSRGLASAQETSKT